MQLQSYNCVLCSEGVEKTLIHLFGDCPFALNCRRHLLPAKNRGTSSYDAICLMIQLIPVAIALDVILMSCWSIWSIRNGKIFRQAPVHFNGWNFYLREGWSMAVIRGKPTKALNISLGLNNTYLN